MSKFEARGMVLSCSMLRSAEILKRQAEMDISNQDLRERSRLITRERGSCTTQPWDRQRSIASDFNATISKSVVIDFPPDTVYVPEHKSGTSDAPSDNRQENRIPGPSQNDQNLLKRHLGGCERAPIYLDVQ